MLNPHSSTRPRVSKIITRLKKLEELLTVKNIFSAIIGNNKISSTSKITKIKDTKKKWTEKKIRWESLELNPHSKGESFSVSSLSFHESNWAKRAIIKAKIKIEVISKLNINIILEKVALK